MEKHIKNQFFKQGHHSLDWAIPKNWIRAIELRNWKLLDELAHSSLQAKGSLFEALSKYCLIKKVEHILSLRTTLDEEGIWHDDGSRELAFSLSLNLSPFTGAGLSIRLKNQEDSCLSLGFRPAGTLTLFLTGQDGFEHKTEKLDSGERLVLAGWLN